MCEKAGVEICFNRFAEKQDVLSENPEIVIIATGGLPNTDILEGADFVQNTWDLLEGSIKPAEKVLLYDDNAAHPGRPLRNGLPIPGLNWKSSPLNVFSGQTLAVSIMLLMRKCSTAAVLQLPSVKD